MNNQNSEINVRKKITIISFICSVLVISIHAYNVDIYGLSTDERELAGIVLMIEHSWSEVACIAIPTFFAISGFLFFRTFSLNNLFEKYKSRFKSVIIPYLIWCTIYYIYFVIITNVPIIKEYTQSIEKYELSFWGWALALWPEAYYTLWFLQYIICFVVLAPVLYLLLRNRAFFPQGSFIIICILINSYFKFIIIPHEAETYVIGSYLAINHKQVVYYKNRILSYIGLVVSVLWLSLIIFQVMQYSMLTTMVFIVAVWFALDLAKLEIDMPWWTKITFFSYVFHDMVLEIVEKIIYIIGVGTPVAALVDYLIGPIITFLIIVFCAKWLKTKKPVWILLNGYR